MKQCHGCRRHIFCQDDVCPFCEIPLPTTGPFVAGVPIALGLTLAACGPQVGDVGDGTESAQTDTGSDTSGPSSMSLSSTAPPMDSTVTTDPTVDDGTTITTDSGSVDDGPVGFYGVPPDFSDMPFECDIITQDCPEGEKCMPWANDGGEVWNATRCSPVAPLPDGLGDPCLVEGSAVSGIDSCAEGLTCFLVGPDGVGTCVPMCTDDEPACDNGATCAVDADVPGIGFCVVPGLCDPLGTDCQADEVCAPTVPGVYQCLPDGSGDMGAYGDPCLAQNSCDSGLLCVSTFMFPECADDHCCTIFCDPAAGALQCPANALGQTCVDLGGGVGACLI